MIKFHANSSTVSLLNMYFKIQNSKLTPTTLSPDYAYMPIFMPKMIKLVKSDTKFGFSDPKYPYKHVSYMYICIGSIFAQF